MPEDSNNGKPEEADNNPSSGQSSMLAKGLVVLIVLLVLVGAVLFTVKGLSARKKPKPYVAKLEGIKRIQEIRFVKHHYESLIPFYKGNNLQFLLVAPADVYGKIDMSLLRYKIGQDSMLNVTLPSPTLSDVWIDLDSTREYTLKKNSLSLMLGGGGKKYLEAYQEITRSLAQSKQDIQKSAIRNKIEEQTMRRAREYINNTANSLGYLVSFVEPQDTAALSSGLAALLKDAPSEFFGSEGAGVDANRAGLTGWLRNLIVNP